MLPAPLASWSSLATVLLLVGAVTPGCQGDDLLLAAAPPRTDGPVELGRVHWRRDLDAAFAEAEQRDKPVLVLFQEIPGCSTCRGFGNGPLSSPLLVDAIESAFVPVAIHNNEGGKDGAALERYGEPAWNNPVVRFFAPDGTELIARQDGVWDEAGLTSRVIAALRAADRDVPPWLELAALEAGGQDGEHAVFAMSCFWEGEAALGALPGVVATRPGFLEGHEVVAVDFDPKVTAWETLLQAATERRCTSRVYATTPEQLAAAREKVGDAAARLEGPVRDAPASDRTYHLNHSPLRWVPLTPAQATRVNAALAAGDDPLAWLSPRQRALATALQQCAADASERLAALTPPEPATVADDAYETRLRAALDLAARDA